VIRYGEIPEIEGVQVLIYQLFYNLINNSLKFSKPLESPTVKINAETVTIDGVKHVRVVIEDNGIGFEPEQGTIIFDTFTRLNSKDKFDGTGLGLSLVKKIVERHNGTIEADGEPDVGARFTITLPLKYKNLTAC
jgi:signal transduction histidine kinase